MSLKFVHVGENPPRNPDPRLWVGRRQWNACVDYHFISAGQHPKYSKQLDRLYPHDIVAAYLIGRGYVGIGKVLERPIRIADFSFNGLEFNEFNIQPGFVDGNIVNEDTVETRPYLRKTIFCNSNNSNSEFAVKINWTNTFNAADAFWERGLFVSHHIVCNLNDIHTKKRLRTIFQTNLF